MSKNAENLVASSGKNAENLVVFSGKDKPVVKICLVEFITAKISIVAIQQWVTEILV